MGRGGGVGDWPFGCLVCSVFLCFVASASAVLGRVRCGV